MLSPQRISSRRRLLGVATFMALLALFSVRAAAADYSFTVLVDSPSGYWRFDETTSTMAAADETGNGHAGTYSGNVTLGVGGALFADPSTAVRFSGPAPFGSVTVPYSSSLDPSTGDFSFEAFISPDVSTNSMVIAAEGVGDPSTGCLDGPGWLLSVDPTGAVSFEIDNASAVPNASCASSTGQLVASSAAGANVADGVWHAVVVTVCRACNTATVYVDGVGQSTSGVPSGSLSSSRPLQIGGALLNSSRYLPMTGTVDEASFYRFALSASQVADHYAQGTTVGGSDSSGANQDGSGSTATYSFGGFGTNTSYSGTRASIKSSGTWNTSGGACFSYYADSADGTSWIQTGIFKCFHGGYFDDPSQLCIATDPIQTYSEVKNTGQNAVCTLGNTIAGGTNATFLVKFTGSTTWTAYVNNTALGGHLSHGTTLPYSTARGECNAHGSACSSTAKYTMAGVFGNSQHWQTLSGSTWAAPSGISKIADSGWTVSGSATGQFTASH